MKAFLSLFAAVVLPVWADDPPSTPSDAAPQPTEEDPATAEEAVPPLAPLAPAPAAVLPDGAEEDIPAPPTEGATPLVEGEAQADDASETPYDLVLKDGRVLKSYQIHNWSKTFLTIFHSTGATSVPANLLPDNIVKAYNMDPALAEQEVATTKAQQQKAAQDSLLAYQERKALRAMPQVKVEGLVKGVHGDGIVIEVIDPQELAGSGYQRVGGIIMDKEGKPVRQYAGQIFGTLWITNHPQLESLVDGDRLRFQARLVGRHQVDGKTYRSVSYEKPLP